MRAIPCLLLFASFCLEARTEADLIVVRARVVTPGRRAEAVAVKDGRFLAVGSNAAIRRLSGPRTQVVDAAGATMTPGFNDAHLHARPYFLEDDPLGSVDLRPSAAASMAQLIERLRAKAARTPEGGWILGERYEDTKLGRHPTRADLDRVSTRHYILLRHSSGHVSSVNSKALQTAGVDARTADPPGGALDRDDSGVPNGVLREAPARSMVLRACPPLPAPNRAQQVEGLKRLFAMFLAEGITSFTDAGTSPEMLRAFQDCVREGAAPRINVLMSESHFDDLRKTGIERGFGDERLRVSGCKIFHGNSLSGATCWLSEPYAHRQDYYGIPPARSQAELDVLIERIHTAGLQAAVHANGDREIDMVLRAFERAQRLYPRAQARHRIEHASIMPKPMMERTRHLGLLLALHSYLYEHGDKMEVYGARRFPILHATRTAWDLGIRIPGNSDFPVSAFRPMLRLQSLVTRKSAEGKVYDSGQRLTVEEALRSYTADSAYASFEEDRKGTIEAGKLADFVLLDGDPFQVTPEGIKDIAVKATYVGGRRLFPR